MIKDSTVLFGKLAPSSPLDCTELVNAALFGAAEFRIKNSRLFHIQNICIQFAHVLIHFIRTVVMKFTFCFQRLARYTAVSKFLERTIELYY